MILYILLIVVSVGIIGSKLYFDKMVDIEFEYFHDNWEADGKPTGGKNSRSNASFLKSDCGTFFSFYEWLISVPAWAQGNSEASKFLIRMRIYTAIFMFGSVSLIAVVIVGKP